MPVVIVLHGGGGNARQMERYAQFNELAEKRASSWFIPNQLTAIGMMAGG